MSEEYFDQGKYEEAFRKAYDEKHEEFEKITREKLIISLIGSVNAGKSKTINALTGMKYAEVKARAGWTKEITLYELKEGVFIADTPGLHDINEDVCEKTSNFVEKDSDIILFFLNAAKGLDKYEKEAFRNITSLGKETLVVLNKIDTIDDDEIDDVIGQIEEELRVTPIPISAKKGTNIEVLNNQIYTILQKKGKDLLYSKISKYKERLVSRWIKAATATAMSIGALPIPGSDIGPLTALQVGLAMKIAYVYDIKPSKNDVMRLIASTVTGSVGRKLVRIAITMMKATGWIPGGQAMEIAASAIAASVAGSTTYAFGWVCNAYYKSGMAVEIEELGAIFEKFYNEHREKGKNVVKDA